jgi:hypothetical protein
MKALRIILYVLGGLVLALAALVGYAAYLDRVDPLGPAQLTQTIRP